MGHNFIGTEHILLALLEVEDGHGPLQRLGVSKDVAERDVLTMMAAIVKS